MNDGRFNAAAAAFTGGSPIKDKSAFLDSIIVEQRHKIDAAEAKIQELEDMLLNGGNSGRNSPLDMDGSRYAEERRLGAPRLFCDICDCFDAHDTEDCPTQSSAAPDDRGSSDVRYQPGQQRPYCEDCEGGLAGCCCCCHHWMSLQSLYCLSEHYKLNTYNL